MGEPAWPTCLPKWRRLDYVFLWSVAQTARFGSLADEPEAAGQICHSHSIWRLLVEPAYYYYYHYLGQWPRMFGYSPDPYPVTPQSFRILFEAIKRTKKRNVAAAASVVPLPLHFNTFITRGQCTTVANSMTWHHIYVIVSDRKRDGTLYAATVAIAAASRASARAEIVYSATSIFFWWNG